MDTITDLISPGDLAERFGMSTGTLMNWRTAGRGPRFVKIGKLVRYRPLDVEAWIEAQTVESTVEARSLR